MVSESCKKNSEIQCISLSQERNYLNIFSSIIKENHLTAFFLISIRLAFLR